MKNVLESCEHVMDIPPDISALVYTLFPPMYTELQKKNKKRTFIEDECLFPLIKPPDLLDDVTFPASYHLEVARTRHTIQGPQEYCPIRGRSPLHQHVGVFEKECSFTVSFVSSLASETFFKRQKNKHSPGCCSTEINQTAGR